MNAQASQLLELIGYFRLEETPSAPTRRNEPPKNVRELRRPQRVEHKVTRSQNDDGQFVSFN